MHFEGSFEAPVTRERLYSFVSDSERLLTVIPNVIESRIPDRSHFSVKTLAGIGLLKGVVDMDFTLVEKKPGKYAKLVGNGRGIQSTIDLTLSLTLEDTRKGCMGVWGADITVGGMLASVGGRLIGSVAEEYVMRITENISQKVS